MRLFTTMGDGITKSKRDVIENMVNKGYNMLDSHFTDNQEVLENKSTTV